MANVSTRANPAADIKAESDVLVKRDVEQISLDALPGAVFYGGHKGEIPMRDPRDCYGGECADCGGWFRDEEDLNEDMLCESCEADAEAAEAEERALEEESAKEIIEPLTLAKPAATDWLAIATDITGAA
jgi:hypothetical protein